MVGKKENYVAEFKYKTAPKIRFVKITEDEAISWDLLSSKEKKRFHINKIRKL